MNRFWICLLLVCIPGILLAQSAPQSRNQVSLSYFGEYLTHTGLRLGGLHIWLPAEDATSHLSHWTTAAFVTHYRHRRNHSGTLLTIQGGRLYQGQKGLRLQAGVELGYMLSQLDGEVYAWNGNSIEAAGKASSHLSWGLSGGIGLHLKPALKLPLSAELLPHLFFQAPYNTLFVPRMALEIRLSYHLP